MKIEDFTVPPDWIPFPTTVAFRYFKIKKVFDFVDGNTTGDSDIDRLKMSAHYNDLVVVRACLEFEQDWIQLLGDDDNPTWQSIKEWLDKQPKDSVVYVVFGSEAKPSQHELTEIALGLEKSEWSFFWVGLSYPNPIELLEGFEERTKGRGVVCTTWAPQLKILRHESVGGFLTHSGWSSVVEAIQSERPLVLLSFLVDQGIIAGVLEEKKMGYCVPRNQLDGSFTRDSVVESLKLVVVEEEGKIYREIIREMKNLFVNEEREEKLMDQFLSYLKMHRNVDEHLYNDLNIEG